MNKIIGVLWKREKDGKEYYSGVLNDLRGKINIAVFANTFKENDNQPDMNIVISWYNPEEKKAADSSKESGQQGNKKNKKKKKSDDGSEFGEDPPF